MIRQDEDAEARQESVLPNGFTNLLSASDKYFVVCFGGNELATLKSHYISMQFSHPAFTFKTLRSFISNFLFLSRLGLRLPWTCAFAERSYK